MIKLITLRPIVSDSTIQILNEISNIKPLKVMKNNQTINYFVIYDTR